MSLAKTTPLRRLGDLQGSMFDFETAGDILAKHNHTEQDVHITIVAKGKIKAYSHDWEMEASAGQLLDFRAGEPHEFMALEDGTRIFNIIKKANGIYLPKKVTKASPPNVKIMCISNVYTRLMHFNKVGDYEIGHKHTFDHGTLVSSGSVKYEVLDGANGNVVASKEVQAPNFIYVDKDKYHRIVALENNTVCACIHALRTNDETLLPPDALIEQLTGDGKNIIPNTVKELMGFEMLPMTAK
jgi:quercetin dioxygenase-like cupin family protein